MKVQFNKDWFAPSDAIKRNPKLDMPMSGRRFRKGVHEDVPQEYANLLPSSAEILEGGPAKQEEVDENVKEELHAADPDRAAAEAMPEPEPKVKQSLKARREASKSKE